MISIRLELKEYRNYVHNHNCTAHMPLSENQCTRAPCTIQKLLNSVCALHTSRESHSFHYVTSPTVWSMCMRVCVCVAFTGPDARRRLKSLWVCVCVLV